MRMVFLVRHGETDWNRNMRLMGNLEIPINSRGAGQIKALTPLLHKHGPGKIYSSPLLRTMQSAEIIGKTLGVDVVPDDRITEMQYGQWEGQPYERLLEKPEFQAYFARPAECPVPGAEDLKDVQKRAVDFVKDMWAEMEEKAVVAVTHADIIRTILAHYLHMDLNRYLFLTIDNGSLSLLQKTFYGITVKRVNVCPGAA